jgi:hypothetical protein
MLRAAWIPLIYPCCRFSIGRWMNNLSKCGLCMAGWTLLRLM